MQLWGELAHFGQPQVKIWNFYYRIWELFFSIPLAGPHGGDHKYLSLLAPDPWHTICRV
jgi:hypothetical protein